MQRLRYSLTFATALALVLAPLSAQPSPQFPVPPQLDLKGAMGFAIENNFAIRQAKERIRQQDGVVVEVSARQIPTVAANATYQQNDREISSAFPASDRAWAIKSNVVGENSSVPRNTGNLSIWSGRLVVKPSD